MECIFYQETNKIHLILDATEEWTKVPDPQLWRLGCTPIEDAMVLAILTTLQNPEGVPTL